MWLRPLTVGFIVEDAAPAVKHFLQGIENGPGWGSRDRWGIPSEGRFGEKR